MTKPLTGADHLLQSMSHPLRLLHLGLVTNNAALTGEGMPVRKALIEAGYRLVSIFSPEHGITTLGEDGAPQPDGTDSLTQLPVVSLYGQSLQPPPFTLANIDALLFDIPDVGCRFYTYLWTMTYCMEACAAAGIPFVVLDRPNPTGGHLSQAEGPMLDEAQCSSFIGRWSIPIRHCCTMGELARYFAATRMPRLQLTVIACTGWENRHSFLNTPAWFTPTSPAIRHIETAIIYPATGFWEGINVQEGRGTDYPFRQMGAPWIDAEALVDTLREEGIPGVSFSPVSFTPAASRYAGQPCQGLRLSITHESTFRPVFTGIKMLQIMKQLYPEKLVEATYPTAANPAGTGHLDKLTGVYHAWAQLATADWPHLINIQQAWEATMKPFLLY